MDWEYDEQQEPTVIKQLKENARLFGVYEDEVEALLDFGYPPDEIEMLLNSPHEFYQALSDVLCYGIDDDEDEGSAGYEKAAEHHRQRRYERRNQQMAVAV